MLVGECGSQCGHCSGKPRLVSHHHIGIALTENHPSLTADLQPSLPPSIEHMLLGEDSRFGRIDVLRRRTTRWIWRRTQVPTPESDHPSTTMIENREDHSIPICIVIPSTFTLLLEQPQLTRTLANPHGIAAEQCQIVIEMTPASWREADPEFLDRLLGESSAMKVFSGYGSFFRLKLSLKPVRSTFQKIVILLVLFLSPWIAVKLLDLNSCSIR